MRSMFGYCHQSSGNWLRFAPFSLALPSYTYHNSQGLEQHTRYASQSLGVFGFILVLQTVVESFASPMPMSGTKVILHRIRIALQCSPKRFGKSIVTSGPAGLLYSRFQELGKMCDFDEALALYRNALELCPQDHPGRALSMGNIANCLYSRGVRLGTVSDLDEALALHRDTLRTSRTSAPRSSRIARRYCSFPLLPFPPPWDTI